MRNFLLLFHSTIWNKSNFIKLWLAQTISYLGDQIYLLALPWLVYNITGSSSHMAIVYGIEMLPYLLFSIVGGVISDQWNKKYSLVIGNLCAIVPLIAVFLLYTQGFLQMWHIYIASFILSSLVAFTLPAFESLIPALLKKDELVPANSLSELSLSGSRIVGPFISGGLIAMVGVEAALLLNAFSYFVAGCLICFVSFTVKNTRKNIEGNKLKETLSQLVEGIIYVPRHHVLRWGIIMSTCGNLMFGAYASVLIYYMRDELTLNSTAVGTVLTFSSVISLLAAGLLSTLVGKHLPNGLVMILSLGLQGVGVIFVSLSSNLLFLLMSQGVYTAAVTLYTINWRTLRQAITPESKIGRVSGVCRGIAFLGASAGGFLTGIVLTILTPSTLFLIEGICVIGLAFIIFVSSKAFKRAGQPEKNINQYTAVN
ncbi:Transmembrane secretion effector [Alteribacillus persepolensis]|uniref:Transmembrane secretion effector n=1 Tax=Alteribacillus persepolensis TaxID=568899 RepID=A0A1G8FXP7_9BACI|nr:MFS transporter [Alteribacillus persepolensis]SDH86845.1 Transmembrane secretion effector [Alteribacillus persepolensis]